MELVKKYRKRVIKFCKNLQLLDQPHDQDAFSLGNRIWGTRSFEMGLEIEEETILPSEEERVEKEKHQEGDSLNRYPFLKETFGFGNRVGKIPVASESAVKSAVGSLRESIVKAWNDKLKDLQIKEMENFVEQLEVIKHQTVTLLSELRSNNDSGGPRGPA